MPDIDSMKTSNYLKKEDVGSGVLVTIRSMVQDNIAQDNRPEDLKWLIFFNEFEKPLVTNVTHREQIASYLNSRNSDDWLNQKVVLWNDKSVVFQGKIGAIRIRPAQQEQNYAPQNYAPQNYAPQDYGNPPQQTQPNVRAPDFDDDIPEFL